jgi:hypothetical protein
LWRTDNAALKNIRTMECPSGIVDRWLTVIADYDFRVEHRPGTHHANADGLSRFGYASEVTDDENEESCGAITPLYKHRLFKQRHLFSHNREEMRLLQIDDEDISRARDWVRDGVPPDRLTIKALSRVGKIYAGLLPSLTIDRDDILRYAVPNSQAETIKRVPCLPQGLWDDTIGIAHVTGGHMAVLPTMQRLQKSLYFPGMNAEVGSYIATCHACQTKKRKSADQRHTLVSPLSGYPFQRIHIDYVGPLSEGRRTGAKWILTVRDSFSKWVEAIPLARATADETVRALEREIFTRYGLPEAIHSDMAKAFESHLYVGVSEMLGIQITNTSGYNPKGNGQVERMHRDLGSIFRAILRDDPDSWEDALPQALFALRTSVCRSTGLPPYQILFGRDVSQPLDVIFGNPNDELVEGSKDYHHYLRKLRSRINRSQAYVRENLRGEVKRQRRQYHKERQCFLAGAKVWLFTPTTLPGASRKLSSYWTGPWVVSATPVNQVMVRIYPDPTWKPDGPSKVVSMDRLKPYRSSRTQPPEVGDDIEMEGDEFAENIHQPIVQLPQADGGVPGPVLPPPPGFPMGLPPAPPPAPPAPPAPYGGLQPPGGGGGGGGGGDGDDGGLGPQTPGGGARRPGRPRGRQQVVPVAGRPADRHGGANQETRDPRSRSGRVRREPERFGSPREYSASSSSSDNYQDAKDRREDPDYQPGDDRSPSGTGGSTSRVQRS